MSGAGFDRGLRRRARGESGMTLPEVMVAMSLMVAVSVIFLVVLQSVQSGIVREQARSTTNDQARLAIEEIDREVRSGDVLYDPATEPSPTSPYYGLRVYTETNAATRGSVMCEQWRIVNTQLKVRRWPSATPSAATAWRTVADSIVNVSQGVHAFELDPSSTSGGRILNVTLLINSKPNDPTSKTIRLDDSVAIRNQVTGTNPCGTVPAG
ncbi:MAG: type II secretion system GspH family protein [Actinomycetota bacterium]|nr:type II secretion system GspH family protein [Actinomycetota bacterium]